MQMGHTRVDAAPPSRWKAACRWLVASEAFAPLRMRLPRRLLALAFLAVLAAFPLVGWATGAMWPVLLLMAPYLALAVLLAAATQGILDRPFARLDEREASQRRSLFREPYITGASLGMVSGLLMAAAFSAEDALLMGAVLALMGFLYGLPSVVLAWTLPDDDPDE